MQKKGAIGELVWSNAGGETKTSSVFGICIPLEIFM